MNYLLKIKYDGANFAGWQIQPSQRTVQGTITKAIETLLKERVNLIGSGRTDAGVHAWGQVANFRFKEKLNLEKFIYSLNSILPDEIAISNVSAVAEEFHARYDARSRSYVYLFSLSKNPFYNKFSYRVEFLSNYDLNKLNEISRFLLGKKDFSSFARNKTEVKNKVCDLQKIHWRKQGDLIIALVEADRFLHGMVKSLLGTILKAYNESSPASYLTEVLKAKDRQAAAQALPSRGLCLFKVKY